MSRVAMREVRVGVVMVATIAGLFGLVVLASGGPAFFSGRRSIDVIFKDGQGIRTGSSVRVAGIDAGRVDAVDLADRDGVLWARVRISVSSNLVSRLKQDAKITIQSGLTGQSWVNIVSSGRSSVALVPGQVVQGVESTMFDPIIEQVGLGAVERGHLSHTIGEVRQTVDAIGPRVRQILASLQESATNLKETSSAIRPSVELAAGKVEDLARRLDTAKIEDTINRVNSLAVHVDGLLTETRPNLEATIASVRRLTDLLQDFSTRNGPKVTTLLEGLNGTRARADQVLANTAVLTHQGAEFFTQNRANLERTTANVRDATNYGNKLVQKLYGNPFYLSPFYKPKPEDVRAQQAYDAIITLSTGAKELSDALKTMNALRQRKDLTPTEVEAYKQLHQQAVQLDAQLNRTAAQLNQDLQSNSIRR
jgi:phospholipid/cholesterol/gamma-HCH transport system substrate-binding protein